MDNYRFFLCLWDFSHLHPAVIDTKQYWLIYFWLCWCLLGLGESLHSCSKGNAANCHLLPFGHRCPLFIQRDSQRGGAQKRRCTEGVMKGKGCERMLLAAMLCWMSTREASNPREWLSSLCRLNLFYVRIKCWTEKQIGYTRITAVLCLLENISRLWKPRFGNQITKDWSQGFVGLHKWKDGITRPGKRNQIFPAL